MEKEKEEFYKEIRSIRNQLDSLPFLPDKYEAINLHELAIAAAKEFYQDHEPQQIIVVFENLQLIRLYNNKGERKEIKNQCKSSSSWLAELLPPAG